MSKTKRSLPEDFDATDPRDLGRYIIPNEVYKEAAVRDAVSLLEAEGFEISPPEGICGLCLEPISANCNNARCDDVKPF
jgi:hypothetical protein